MPKLRMVDYINSFAFIQIIEDGETYKIQLRSKIDQITGKYLNLDTDQMINEPTYWIIFPKYEKQPNY